MKRDYSKQIYEKYFGIKHKVLKVTLKNGKELYGIFVSVVHGDSDVGETYVLKWHFVPEEQIEKYISEPLIDFSEVYALEINQDDIKEVCLK